MLLNGSEIVVECLKEQGVDTVFGYPGGTILNIYDAIYKEDKINHYLVSHEQGAAHAADGYARSTGKVGVCFATLIAIPGLCSLLIKPITNRIFNKKDEKKQQEQPQKLDIVGKPANDVKFNGNNIYPKTNNILPINKNNIFTSMNSTMRVG